VAVNKNFQRKKNYDQTKKKKNKHKNKKLYNEIVSGLFDGKFIFFVFEKNFWGKTKVRPRYSHFHFFLNYCI